MRGGVRSRALFLSGLLVSVIPPIAATLSYFPLWRERGAGAVLSGFTVMLLLIAAVPIFRTVGRFFKSPASYTVWLMLFLLFFFVSAIADEMTVICFTGFISNLIGAVLFKLSRKEPDDARDRNA